jgi:long-chain acyl-CoA synthetase
MQPLETVNAYLFRAMARFADLPMQVARERTWTFREGAEAIHGVARALADRGVEPGDRIAILAENSPQWLHAYLGCLAVGAVVVPRGEDITGDELDYILDHAECRIAFAGSSDAEARLGNHAVIRLDTDAFPGPAPLEAETLERYATARAPEDLAVILYTSGTTGRPKGVMLEHRNIAHNLRVLPPLVDMQPRDAWVSILPSWHTFEQTVELCGFASGCTTIYSDKRRLKEDLRKHRPQFFASVPRVWEAIYKGARDAIAKRGPVVRTLFRLAYQGSRMWRNGNPLGWPLHALGSALFYGKIRAATGGRLKYAVSGGGYLPRHVDDFFDRVGVSLLIGYGLTETAPVVALRDPADNVLGTIGRAVPETEIRVGPEGTFQVRGPQIMRGYYKDAELTRAVLDDDGWFDTGDLGRMTDKGDLVFVGRAKETIVLSGGENIEPEPIEQKLLDSELIAQVIIVGQDRKFLGALVVPEPESGATREQVLAEVRARSHGPQLRSFEGVNRVALLDEPFTVENGLLTPTQKMRRNVIAARYADVIETLYA